MNDIFKEFVENKTGRAVCGNYSCARNWQEEIFPKEILELHGNRGGELFQSNSRSNEINSGEKRIEKPLKALLWDKGEIINELIELCGKWLEKYQVGKDIWEEKSEILYRKLSRNPQELIKKLMETEDGGIVLAWLILCSLLGEDVNEVYENYQESKSDRKNDEWIDRRDDIKKIENHFKRYGILFLHGDAGIGKTELAIHYGELQEQKGVKVLFLNFINSIQDTFGQIESTNERMGETTEEKYKRIMAELKRNEEEQRIIIDNFDVDVKEIIRIVDSPEMQELIKNIHIKILFTTRNVFGEPGMSQIKNLFVEVPVLNEEELIKLFKRIYKTHKDVEKLNIEMVKNFIQGCYGNIYIISLVAKVLTESDKVTGEVNQMLNDYGQILNNDVEIYTQKYRKKRWGTIIQILGELWQIGSLSDREQKDIFSLGMLMAKGVPLNILKKLLKEGYGETYDWKKIRGLVNKGWIKERKEEYSLHPLLTEFVWKYIEENRIGFSEIPLLQGLQRILDIKEVLLTEVEKEEKLEYVQVCKHLVLQNKKKFWEVVGKEESRKLFYNIGFLLYSVSEYDIGYKACELAEELFDESEKDSLLRAEILLMKARCYSNFVGEKESIPLYKAMQEECHITIKENDSIYYRLMYPYLWACLDEGDFRDLKDFKEVEERLSEVLRHIENKYGVIGDNKIKEDISAEILFGIAQIYHVSGIFQSVVKKDNGKAVEFYEDSCKIWEQLSERYYQKEILSKSAKAMSYLEDGDFEGAYKDLNAAKEYCEEHFQNINKHYRIRTYENLTEYFLYTDLKHTEEEIEEMKNKMKIAKEETEKIFKSNSERMEYCNVLYQWSLGQAEKAETKKKLEELRKRCTLVRFL